MNLTRKLVAKKNSFNTYNTSSGFTLIELLIVIVIIGILAGVLISVINPIAQQNRAKDANVKATMSKVALATEGFISAYGSAPNDSQFMGSFTTTATASGTNCDGGGSDFTCMFTVTGNALGETCSVSGYMGIGTDQCFYYYNVADSTNAPTEFELMAKAYGIVDTVFRYTNGGTAAGQIQHCDETGASCITPAQ